MTTISQERSALAKVGMRLRRREEWGARRSYTDGRAVVEPATRVFVHITITNPGSYSNNDAHARAVEAIGISRFPNTGISYNRLVMPDGSLYEAQPIGRRGAHTVNDFKRSTCSTSGCPGRGSSITAPSWNLNYNSRAYVICQNVQHVVTAAMVDALARAIAADKLAGFVTRGAAIHGHRCVSAKSCPGDRMWAWMGKLDDKVSQYVTNGLTGGTPPEEDDMTPEQIKDALHGAIIDMANGDDQRDRVARRKLQEIMRLDMLAALIRANAHDPATVAALADAVASAVVAKLPTGTTNGTEIVAAVKQGLREVLGSLDDEPVNPT